MQGTESPWPHLPPPRARGSPCMFPGDWTPLSQAGLPPIQHPPFPLATSPMRTPLVTQRWPVRVCGCVCRAPVDAQRAPHGRGVARISGALIPKANPMGRLRLATLPGPLESTHLVGPRSVPASPASVSQLSHEGLDKELFNPVQHGCSRGSAPWVRVAGTCSGVELPPRPRKRMQVEPKRAAGSSVLGQACTRDLRSWILRARDPAYRSHAKRQQH